MYLPKITYVYEDLHLNSAKLVAHVKLDCYVSERENSRHVNPARSENWIILLLNFVEFPKLRAIQMIHTWSTNKNNNAFAYVVINDYFLNGLNTPIKLFEKTSEIDMVVPVLKEYTIFQVLSVVVHTIVIETGQKCGRKFGELNRMGYSTMVFRCW